MWRALFLSLSLVVAMTHGAAAIEEPKYKAVRTFADFEVRDYAPYIVAETTANASFEDAGNQAFQRLFEYISGGNSTAQSITMTAPVIQRGQKIEMTAPVIQAGSPGSFTVQFVMPSNWTLDKLPIPHDTRVRIRAVPACRFAVIRYSGFWSLSNYESNLRKLENAMRRENLGAAGQPIWARYDPPFMPWFWRRNEIMIPIKSNEATVP